MKSSHAKTLLVGGLDGFDIETIDYAKSNSEASLNPRKSAYSVCGTRNGCKAYAKGMFFMCNRMIIVKKRGKRINYYSIEGGSVGKRLGAGRH